MYYLGPAIVLRNIMSKKTFLFFNGDGTDPTCTADLKHLLELTGSDSTVRLLDIANTNLDGLSKKDNPIIVIPPGSSSLIASSLSTTDHLKLRLSQNWGYLGICAGAYIAARDSHWFNCNYNKMISNYGKANYMCSLSDIGFKNSGYNVIQNSDSYGPFFPNDSFKSDKSKSKSNEVPYLTTINVSGTDFYQLYINGCGFALDTGDHNHDLVGYYADKASYSFFNDDNTLYKTIEPMASLVAKTSSKDRGAYLVSGTHLEAAVPGSKLLDYAAPKNASAKRDVLDPESFKILQDNAPGNLKQSLDLINITFG